MAQENMSSGVFTLWGAAPSYYTAKIRSYLIKKRVPYREWYPSHPEYGERILPVVGHLVVPVLETPDKEILQDTTDMIEHLEARFAGSPMVPGTPVQRVVAWLVDGFGSEGLLQAAMHYRWSYRAEQESFLRAEFGRIAYSGGDRSAREEAGKRLMDHFHGFLPQLGVTEETSGAVEAAFGELVDALDAHFAAWPYVLGGRPSIADCGLMGPLYAHLGRDPVPSTIMKSRAPNVFRWTERMNLANIADGEFFRVPECYAEGDAIPETLEPVLRLLFQDWGAELLANAAHFEAWIAEDPSRPAGSLVSVDDVRRVHPTLGPLEYAWRGCTVRRHSAPHGLWHFEKAAAHARALRGDARARFSALLERCGGARVMAIEPSRAMKRERYALVLG